MSVISHKEAQAHATATFGKRGERQYTAPYHVTTSTARDGPIEILGYLQDHGLSVGHNFEYGAEVDYTCFCESVRPARKPNSLTEWTVTLQYSTPKPGDSTDDENNPVDNPLLRRWDIQFSSQTFAVPVWKAWNFSAMGAAGGYVRPAETLGPVVNSAGAVLDPPLMRQQQERMLTVSGNLPYYSENVTTPFINTINITTLYPSSLLQAKYGVYPTAWLPYTIKCTDASAAFSIENNVTFWRYTYSFRIRERSSETNPQNGWLEDVLDRGYSKSLRAGEDDGRGGSVSASDIEGGMAVMGHIRDPLGNKTPELVLLDGAGQPVVAGSDNEKNGVYITWRIDPVSDLTLLPLAIFTATAPEA